MLDFVHLHTHSDYSLLDGAASIDSLVQKAVDLKMSHLALTDHGNMFGALKFYKTCKNKGIKPIIGSEFYLAPQSRLNKTTEKGMAKNYHLLLLASNEQGYRNLMELSSRGYTEGFYYKPRIDDNILQEYSAGLICLTACLAGEIPSLILLDSLDQARKKALFYDKLFGRGNFYLELQDHGIPAQKKVNRGLIQISRDTNIPLIATNDIHYTAKDDALAQDIIICIGTNKKLSDGKRLKFEHSEFYFKTAEEMYNLFSYIPQAIKNTNIVAEKCNLQIPLPGPQLPDYQVPAGFTREKYLEKLSMEGLTRRYKSVTTEMMKRLHYELSVINSMGYSGYFLIVWDFIRFARQHNIPVGPGRGSGAGSLVAYCLKITDIDPLKYGLLFERFLNPERVSMPDFDIDFCYERRNEVIEYVTKKYGEHSVAQIITFGTLKARAVIRDVARVLDISYDEADSIAKHIPFAPKMNLDLALKMEPKLREIQNKGQVYHDLIVNSKKLEGLNRHASTHAAGIVIGKQRLSQLVPLYKEPRTGTISTQYTMDYLEECGLVKMDFLGLKTLTLIQNTLHLLKKQQVEIDIHKIPEDDPATFKMLSQGKSTCIFQFESAGMQNILKKAKPEKIEDLIALNALYRPGPMENIDQFIKGKHNWESIEYPLPELESVLKETYGVIIYQEQVMEIARKVAGFTLGQADILRRAMGKKKKAVMDQQKVKFVEGALKNGYKKKVAEDLFELLIPFAGYGFNKSHAAAYSLVAYQTAYLKANYPAEFMAANLTNEIHNTDKLSQYIGEARDMNIQILPPDINLSEREFICVDGKIVYGLMGIKNVGTAAVDEIIKKRKQNGPYKSILNFLERVDLKVVNKKVVEALILTGTLDCFKQTRATLFINLERIMEIAGRRKEQQESGQGILFEEFESEEYETLALETIPEWSKKKILMDERQNIGFFFSGHPLDDYKKYINKYSDLDLHNTEGVSLTRSYTVIGLIKDIKEIITKKGKKMAFACLEDYRDSIELVIFTDAFQEAQEILTENEVLAVRGRIDKSRGDAKLIVDKIDKPERLPKKRVKSIHLRLKRELMNEENAYHLRDFILGHEGNCLLYFHINSSGNGSEIIIRADDKINIQPRPEVIERLKRFPQVIEVWKE